MSYENIIYEGQQILDCLDYDREMITGSDYEKGYENLQENEDSLGDSDKERWCRFKCDMECIDALDSETQDLLTSIFESPDNLCSYHLNMLEKLVDCKYSLSDKYQNAIEQTQKKLETYKEFKSNQLQGVREILEKLESDSTLSEIETVALAQHTKGYCEKLLRDVAENATKALEGLPTNLDNLRREYCENYLAAEAQKCLVDPQLLAIVEEACESVEREHISYETVSIAEANVEAVTLPDYHSVVTTLVKATENNPHNVYQTSQNGETRYNGKGNIRDHQGEDYGLGNHLGVIINPAGRKAIVVGFERDENYNPGKENTSYLHIASIPREDNGADKGGIYVTTYRHMNRIPNDIKIGEKLRDEQILGDYRKIIAEEFIRIDNEKEIIINGKKVNVEGLTVKIADREIYLQKIDTSPADIEIQAGDDVKIAERIHFINGGQPNYDYGLDGDQFFQYENNEVKIEHLHIEKKYLQGDSVKKILTDGGINRDEAKQVGEAILDYNRQYYGYSTAGETQPHNAEAEKEAETNKAAQTGFDIFNADSRGKIEGGIEIFTRGTDSNKKYIDAVKDFLESVTDSTKNTETRIVRDIAALHVLGNVIEKAIELAASNPCPDNNSAVNSTRDKVKTTIENLLKKIEETKLYTELKSKLN